MAAKATCMIIDDEPLAVELIESHLSKIGTIRLVASCNNALKAHEILRSRTVDLLFLDIEMPVITGLDFLKSLKNPPKVIITTAFRNYALEGYELDVVDYLLKPITFTRFLKAIDKFHQLSEKVPNHPTEQPSASDFLYLKSNKKNYKVFPAEILYVESIKDYIHIHSKEETLVLKMTMSDVEALFPADLFLRIHRSYLVNVRKITAFNATEIEIGKKSFPIGTSYRQGVGGVLNRGAQEKNW